MRVTGRQWPPSVHTEVVGPIFDALIVAGALVSGAESLLTEDLQHDRQIGALRIINPFR